MSDLLSGQIHFTGLGSGTDFSSMVKKLVEIEQTHIKRLQTWRKDWSDKVDSFQELNGKLLSMRSTLTGMDTVDEFLVKTAVTTNPDALTAKAGSSAVEGSYQVLVNQLAQNDIWTHSAGELSATSDITDGADSVFSYTYKGTTVSIDVAAGTSLERLADLINRSADNPGVRASIISSGQAYHLQVRGLDLGEANALSFGEGNLAGYGPTGFEHSQTAQDAEIRVDGFPASGWLKRSTNTISDVLPGLTLTLRSATTTPITVSVARDDEAIKEAVRTFVRQTNDVLALIRSQMKVDAKTKTGSILTGNYGVQIIQQKLKLILAGKGVGFDYGRDSVVNLSSIGITTDANEGSATMGQLLLDESALQAALDRDPDAVAALFSAAGSVLTNSSDFSPATPSFVKGITRPGTYEVTYTIDAEGRIASATIGGVAASIDNESMTITGLSGDARGLSILVRNTAEGSYAGTASIRQGKAAELIEQISMITDVKTGTLNILENNYQDIMDSIDKKIAYEEERIARMERDLRNRFAKLEALLGYYEQLNGYIANQYKSMSQDSK
jgi:flagellar hook-associated protein 2